MASKFFSKPQLGQAQLTNAQQSTLPTNDAQAQDKARKAAQSIDMLTKLSLGAVSSITGAYQENIKAKDRLESGKKKYPFMQHVEGEISKTENFESLGDEALTQKYTEFSESFLEQHKDKPYAYQLKVDMERMGESMVGNMMKKRDAMHTQIVSDSTAEGASNVAQLYSEGLLSVEQVQGRLTELSYDSTLAFQVPSSSGLDIDRSSYQGLTREQSNEALLRGIMIQTGKPNNSKVAELIDDPTFRKELGISPTDEDYNKLVHIAYQKGAKADKVHYETVKDDLKESLYTKTNQGFNVNIDKELNIFKSKGGSLTAQDEHRLRNQFKQENTTMINSSKYRSKIADGVDLTIGMPPKDKEATLQRVFTDELGITGQDFSITSINSQLQTPSGQKSFGQYTRDGGELPKSVSKLFDVPAGDNTGKWIVAENTLISMQAAMSGSGKSVDQLVGVEKVARVRAFSNMLSDDSLTEQEKREQRILLSNSFANINSRGFVKPMKDSTLDPEVIAKKAKDADWTIDNLGGYRQNQELITHYAALNEMSGMSSEDAVDKAVAQFDLGHAQFELPDGAEIAVPVDHKLLNPIGLKMFARGNSDINDRIQKNNFVFANDYRTDRQISMRKSPDFNKSKEYILTFDGQVVSGGRFTYDQYTDYINKLPRDKQLEVDKDKHMTREEKKAKSLEIMSKRKKAKGSGEDYEFNYGQFDLKFTK